jgi:hypothetical protein
MAASAAEDERMARRMQEAEMGQAPHVAQGTVVQGVAVHPHAVSIGAPRVPAGPVIVEAIPDVPADEIVVLSLRYSVMCFALIDFVMQVIPAVFFWVEVIRCNAHEKCELISGMPLWAGGLVQVALMLGPLCGIVGARRMHRGLVSAYLVFCLLSLVFKAFFLTAGLWFFLLLFVQIWITWIVCKFWSALGSIPKERVAQMQDPDYLEKAPVRIVYW